MSRKIMRISQYLWNPQKFPAREYFLFTVFLWLHVWAVLTIVIAHFCSRWTRKKEALCPNRSDISCTWTVHVEDINQDDKRHQFRMEKKLKSTMLTSVEAEKVTQPGGNVCLTWKLLLFVIHFLMTRSHQNAKVIDRKGRRSWKALRTKTLCFSCHSCWFWRYDHIGECSLFNIYVRGGLEPGRRKLCIIPLYGTKITTPY